VGIKWFWTGASASNAVALRAKGEKEKKEAFLA